MSKTPPSGTWSAKKRLEDAIDYLEKAAQSGCNNTAMANSRLAIQALDELEKDRVSDLGDAVRRNRPKIRKALAEAKREGKTDRQQWALAAKLWGGLKG